MYALAVLTTASLINGTMPQSELLLGRPSLYTVTLFVVTQPSFHFSDPSKQAILLNNVTHDS